MTGVRITKKRQAVLDQVRASGEFQSAQQIHGALTNSGVSIGLATVYRALSALASDGVINARKSDDGETQYRQCDTPRHHHHVICRECGATAEIAGTGLEKMLDRLGAEAGFSDLEHEIEVRGTCQKCA
ncbi:MAG: transcriptional repressor [Promicromonosporaceae bacterium]|nr:transcriptional repressor [Promicromonosporaceae bacterium]